MLADLYRSSWGSDYLSVPVSPRWTSSSTGPAGPRPVSCCVGSTRSARWERPRSQGWRPSWVGSGVLITGRVDEGRFALRATVHGDLNPRNQLYRDDQLVAVIGTDACRVEPLVWEVAQTA